jgi:Ca-activated chloride channel family protein
VKRALLVAALAALLVAACDSRQTAGTPTQPASKPTAGGGASAWPFIGANSGATAPTALVAGELTRSNYYIVFDASGSMNESRCSGDRSKLDVAKQALLRFASRLPASANLGLHVFDSQGIRQLLPLGPLDRATLEAHVDAVRAGGGTPLAESALEAYGVLTAQGRKQLGYGEYHLVIVTDGEATGEDPGAVVNRIVGESPVLVNTIGFCLSDNHSLNQAGRVIYKAADNPAALEQTLADVLAEAPSFDVTRFEAAKK